MEAVSSDSPLSNFTFTHTTQIQREENGLKESYNGFLAPRKCLREMLEYNVKSVVDSKYLGEQEEKMYMSFIKP